MTDPFRTAREASPVLACEFQGETLPMLLRHEDVRMAAKDWRTFSSDAPFRVPIPSEEAFRTVRQLPIETDPPEHTDYRQIVEPFFRRAREPEMVAKVERLITGFIVKAVQNPSVEVVREFALPIQSIALTYLLNVPEEEAQIWIGWGTHVFRDGDSGSEKGAALEQYLQVRFDRALEGDGADFFSALTRATFRGRPLSREEMIGFANLTFAGGRDTIIQSIASIIAYLARNPAALEYLRDDAKRAVHAGEEFFRAFMPLTHIGRVCPVQTAVHGVTVPSGGRISLGWAAANYDPTVFEAPEEIRLDRQPNPHLSFGFGTHLCLGAPHARLIVRTLLKVLAEKVGSITTIHAEENIEVESSYRRVNGYRSLTVSLAAARP